METTPDADATNIIDRVLKLRRCMGIDNELSTADPRDALFFPSEMEISECSITFPSAYNRRQWLVWDQKPGDPPPPPGGD